MFFNLHTLHWRLVDNEMTVADVYVFLICTTGSYKYNADIRSYQQLEYEEEKGSACNRD